MLGILDNKEIEEVLTHQVLGRIGCHAEDTTYIVPISYAYDGTYIYGHTRDGMKVSIMRTNPKVCFQVDDMKDMANWKSVITWGQFEEVHEKAERNKSLQALIDRILPIISSELTHLSPEWPFASSDLGAIKGIVFRIRVTKKTGRFETNEMTPHN